MSDQANMVQVHVYCHLNQSPSRCVKDLAIKSWLVDTFRLDKRERASILLPFLPTRRLKTVSHSGWNTFDSWVATLCFLLEQLFLERRPEDIRLQLVHSKIDSLVKPESEWLFHITCSNVTCKEQENEHRARQTVLLSSYLWRESQAVPLILN